MKAKQKDLTAEEETAVFAGRAMWAKDRAAKAMGMELIEVVPGAATLAMVVREDMLNGHDVAHGGYIFSLADTAFAYACNSGGDATLAQHCSITFVRRARLGERLVAQARELSRSGRSGTYDARVSVDGAVIAEFRGLSRKVGGSFVDPPCLTGQAGTPCDP